MTRILLAASALLAVAFLPSTANATPCAVRPCIYLFDYCARINCHPCFTTPEAVICV